MGGKGVVMTLLNKIYKTLVSLFVRNPGRVGRSTEVELLATVSFQHYER